MLNDTSNRCVATFGILVLSLIGCDSHKLEEQSFKEAERLFNAGLVDTSSTLYEEFIRIYPTSQWRVTAEEQLQKCRDIKSASIKAEELVNGGDYRSAIIVYNRIAELNKYFINSDSVIKNLLANDSIEQEKKRKKEKEHRKVKEIQQEIGKANESLYRATLLTYYQELLMCRFLFVDAIGSGAVIPEDYWALLKTESVKDALDKESYLYRQLRELPEPSELSGSSDQVKQAHSAIAAIAEAYNRSYLYSRFTLQQEIARQGTTLSLAVRELKLLMGL